MKSLASLARTDASVWGKRKRLIDLCVLCNTKRKETFVEAACEETYKKLSETIISYAARKDEQCVRILDCVNGDGSSENLRQLCVQ